MKFHDPWACQAPSRAIPVGRWGELKDTGRGGRRLSENFRNSSHLSLRNRHIHRARNNWDLI